MANEKEVGDAVEFYKAIPQWPAELSVLIALAEEWLAVEGLPEKIDGYIHPSDYHKGKVDGWDKCVDSCRLAIAKHYIPKDRLLTVDEIMDCCDDYGYARRILAAQQRKIEGGK